MTEVTFDVLLHEGIIKGDFEKNWRSLFEEWAERLDELEWESFEGLSEEDVLEEVRTQVGYRLRDAWAV